MTYRVVGRILDYTKDERGYKKGWVCEYCGEHTTTVYIPTSHDHTDESVEMCTCGQGKRFQDVWPVITKHIFPTYSMETYKEYFA